MSLNVNIEHIEKNCKVGKGSNTCRYLLFGMNGFQCAKDNTENKKAVDENWATKSHGAQGDNCVGYVKFNKEKEMDSNSNEPTEKALNVSNSETESGTNNRNQNDKRYEEPFEDEGAYADDFDDE